VETYRVQIEGISPLLQHRYAAAEGPEPQSVMRRGKKDWRAEAEENLYRTPEGTVYQPAVHIESAIVKASVNYQIPGKRKKTYKDLCRTGLLIEPDAIPHVHQAWKIENNQLGRPVIVNRGRVMRYRPELMPWALDFTISIIDDELPPSVVLEILQDAGRRVGIGDYRPKFGRFQVVAWEKLQAASDGQRGGKAGRVDGVRNA
jgi:hypothetical protein